MKRLLSVLVLALVVLAPCAYADSILNINITFVTGVMYPGGGVFLTLIGPGTIITASAGMACHDWCDGFPIPDLTSVAASQVFIGSFQSAIVGGITYNADNDISLNCCLFDFSGSLNGSVSGFVGEGERFKLFNLTLPGGGGWSFNFTGSSGYYQFVDGSFSAGTPPVTPTPEPGTLGLMATGLAGLAGVIRRRRLIRR